MFQWLLLKEIRGVWKRSEEAEFHLDFSDCWNIFKGDISCLCAPKEVNVCTLFNFAFNNQNETFLQVKHICVNLEASYCQCHLTRDELIINFSPGIVPCHDATVLPFARSPPLQPPEAPFSTFFLSIPPIGSTCMRAGWLGL